jgi:hemerythrin
MFYELWSPEFTGGLSWVDGLHSRIALALRQVSAVGDRDFSRAYKRLIGQLEILFREEEDRMEESDPAFQRTHREQHARVLHGLHCAHSRVLDGDIALGRHIVDELLPRWLGTPVMGTGPSSLVASGSGEGGSCITYL